MTITIGTNIKRLRSENGITQEQLAEAMNISCAAVSKWERGETYPDITMLQPLAFYFGVTLDELMGYDKEKVNEQIEHIIEKYWKCLRNDWKKANNIITDAYREFPNDYRIMNYYMWSRGIEDAEPDLEKALAYKDELSQICDKIIGGCTDGLLRLSAWKMKAILLHAEGKTQEALQIHTEKCGSWWNTSEQMHEQLFKKDRPEFLYWVKHNMYELVDFAADKLVKSYFFDPNIPYDKMVGTVEKLGEEVFKSGKEFSEPYLLIQAKTIFGRLLNDLKSRGNRGGTEKDIIRITDKYLSVVAVLSDYVKNDELLMDALLHHHTEDFLKDTIDSLMTWKNPRNIEMQRNEEYMNVIDKYRKNR